MQYALTNFYCFRSMGQNYVTKDEVLAAIVRGAGVRAGDAVLEIGPGTGNLTKHLLLAGARVLAIEKDDALFERLQDEFRDVRSRRHIFYACQLHIC